MSKRTYPVPNKNLSGSDYIQNKRAKQLFSGTSNLAKTIEEQNGNFPLLTPLGKLKPYQGTYGLSGRSYPSEKTYCLNTSHSYRDLLAITKGKYLLTPPNIANESEIQFKDVSNAQKLYNGLYYTYSYNTTNALAYMNPGYPSTPATYVANRIEYSPLTDASQRIIVDPSYVITYSSESCVLYPSVARNIKINNNSESKYSFNRTINLDLLTGFQYPSKFSLDYDNGDCINASNDIQTKYAYPVPPIPPSQTLTFIAGGQGTNQAILAWSDDGIFWSPSNNGNTIFTSYVNSIKYDGNSTWLAVGGNSTDPSGNVIAYSIDGKNWIKSFTINPVLNANNLLINAKGVEWNVSIGRWIVVGQPKVITDPSGVVLSYPTIITSADSNNWTKALSTDPSLNNPFGVNGIGVAVATNNETAPLTRAIIAVGTGSKLDSTPINMVKSNNGLNWSIISSSPYSNIYPPYSIIYAPSTTSKWLVGGTGFFSTISPIYYSTDTTTWSPALPLSGGSINGVCYDIAYRGDFPVPLSANYVAVGSNIFGLSNIVYSYDGINWSASNNGNLFQPRSVSCITFFGFIVIWVVIGTSGNTGGYSSDGINWNISPNANGIFINGALSVGSITGA